MSWTAGAWASNGLVEWTEGDTAYLSVAFSWKLDEAYARAQWHRAAGRKVRAGGPGLFTRKHYLADVAEIGGDVPDALARHNPMATKASDGCPVGCFFGSDETSELADVDRVIRMLRGRGVGSRRIQVYTMIGHEPFAACMDRIRHVISRGGEPYVQPIMKLNALRKEPWVRHDWTAQRLRQVQRWANRRLWKVVDFADYDASAKTSRKAAAA